MLTVRALSFQTASQPLEARHWLHPLLFPRYLGQVYSRCPTNACRTKEPDFTPEKADSVLVSDVVSK